MPGSALLSAARIGVGCVIISYALIGLRRPVQTVAGMVLGLALIF